MNLYNIIQEEGGDRIFILGMAKNAGKTSTLNHLIAASADYNERLGITSTGRDGETLDLITGKAKPRIFCPRGTLVATARQALGVSSAGLRDLQTTGIYTPLGEVVIGEVSTEGYLELAGPLYAGDLDSLLKTMTDRGAQRIFVDGSLDRKAAGRVLDKIVLAVGAVVSPCLEEVVEQAVTWAGQLSMPPAPPWVLEAVKLSTGPGGLISEPGKISPFRFKTLLGKGHELVSLVCETKPWGIYITGALGEDMFRVLLDMDPLPRIIVRNASSLFVNPSDWRLFCDLDGEILATHPLRLLAVTVNPFSPEGWEFPPEEFLQAIKEALQPVPVMNPGPWNMQIDRS